MSEIYLNTSQDIFLDVYGGDTDGTPTCVATIGGVNTTLSVNPDTPVGTESQRYRAVLDLSTTANSGTLQVKWDFSIDSIPVIKKEFYEVVTPLLSVVQIRERLNLDEDDVTDDQIIAAERRVRHVIENLVGQKFQQTVETVQVFGSGGPVLRLPKRAISIDTVDYWTAGYTVVKDGWAMLRMRPPVGSVIKSDVPIYNPYDASNYYWTQYVPVVISGTWGWESVPTDVSEAALILIEEELSDERTYRDRYLTSMTAADWRIQFHPAAFTGTGSVVVDQLLTKYKVSNMAVV